MSKQKKQWPHVRDYEMFEWLTDVDRIAAEETGLQWRRRLISETVAKPGVWAKALANRLSKELADAINSFAGNEVWGMDEYGSIATLMVWEGLYHMDWDELAVALLDHDGFYSGTERQKALPAAEVEAYLARTPVAAVA